MNVHELTACPVCGSTRAERLLLSGAKGEHPLRRCSVCGLTYAEAYADPDDIYVDGYLSGDTQFGLDVRHPVIQEMLDFCATKRLQAIEKAVRGRGALLDVGCGSGEVLRTAIRRGWQATGVEPVAASVTMCLEQGLDVHNAMLEESGLPERSYDAVTAFHVLEHLPSATDFLRSVARWARPGGHVVIEVPNFRSFHRRNVGSGWPGLRPLEHVAHYAPANLRDAFVRAGLEPVKVRTIGFLWQQQSLDHMLSDLGLARWRRYFAPLCHEGEVGGKAAIVPGRAVRLALHGVQAAYDVARVGQGVFGIARVPS